MKLSKAEYEEMIRKKPSLRPTESISFKSTHNELVGVIEGSLGENEHNPSLEPQNSYTVPKTHQIRPSKVNFIIPGQPVGKPRMTQQDKWKKRPTVMKYWRWADKARSSVPKGTDLMIYRQLSIIVYLEFPKTYSTKRKSLLSGQPHFGRGDCDNFIKAAQDSLFKQDCVIWKVSGEKRWDDNLGARMEVELS